MLSNPPEYSIDFILTTLTQFIHYSTIQKIFSVFQSLMLTKAAFILLKIQ